MTFPYSEPVTHQFTAWCAKSATGERFLGNLAHGSAGQRSQHQTQPGVAARAARSPPRAPAVTQRHADGLPIELHVVSRRPVDSSGVHPRSEEHTSELQSLMRTSYAVFCLKKTNQQ